MVTPSIQWALLRRIGLNIMTMATSGYAACPDSIWRPREATVTADTDDITEHRSAPV